MHKARWMKSMAYATSRGTITGTRLPLPCNMDIIGEILSGHIYKYIDTNCIQYAYKERKGLLFERHSSKK